MTRDEAQNWIDEEIAEAMSLGMDEQEAKEYLLEICQTALKIQKLQKIN